MSVQARCVWKAEVKACANVCVESLGPATRTVPFLRFISAEQSVLHTAALL